MNDFEPISPKHQHAYSPSYSRYIYQGADNDNMSLVTLRGQRAKPI